MIQKNEAYEVEITGMTEEGDGVGRIGGQAIFIPYTLPGEVVRALAVRVNKHYAYGKMLEVVRPSRHRCKAECPYFYQCGGCSLWHMDYAAELAFKQHKVEDCLRRIGKLDVPVSAIVGCEDRRYYRNKAQFPVTPEGIGFYRKRSHTVIDMNDCLIQKPFNARILQCVREWMKAFSVPAYDEKTHTGVIRHIYTRCGESGVLVCLVTRTAELLHGADLVRRLCALDIPVVGIVQNINPKRTNVILGDDSKTLYGTDRVVDRIGPVQFQISPRSFYQVNRAQTEKLYQLAMEFAGLTGKETVWDLYCGIGTIGQFMARQAKRIVGVEIVQDAVDNARENAALNGITNAVYFCGAAEKLAPELLEKGLRPDVVVLDPPRKGCDESLLQTVVQCQPKRIVYISCKPSTLARDARILDQSGYAAVSAVPCDLFPATHHVETVCLLSKTEK